MPLFNTKFFCTETKFFFVELDGTQKYPRQDLDAYVRRFNAKALDYCDQMVDEVLVDVCLNGTTEE